jgi:hypothetical protein
MDRAAVGSTSLLMALLADGVAEGLLGGAMGMPWFGALDLWSHLKPQVNLHGK